MTSVDSAHILLHLKSWEEPTAYVLAHPIGNFIQKSHSARKMKIKLVTNFLVSVSASVWARLLLLVSAELVWDRD